MKKILAIDQGEHIGGAEIFLAEILGALSGGTGSHKSAGRPGKDGSAAHGDLGKPREGDFEVHLLTAGTGKYLQSYEHSGVKIHQIEIPRLKPFSIGTILRFRRAAAAIARKMGEINPDIVISNTVRAHILSSAAAHKNNIPLLWMAHDISFPKMLLKRFIRFPKSIICCSRFVRDYYSAALPRRSSSKLLPSFEVVYPFGITKEKIAALAAIAPDKFGIAPAPVHGSAPAASLPHISLSHSHSAKSRVVGMVGNFIPWKGQDLFIKMAAAVHARHPETTFEIIGRTYEGNPASKEYRAECENLAADLIAKKVLKIRESVPSAIEEMAKWQILVHCSKDPEPLGRVILEGMSAGCAVIASNLGGPREIITGADFDVPAPAPGVTTTPSPSTPAITTPPAPDGLLIHPDTESLIKAVSSLLAAPEKMDILAQNARAKILREFDREKVFAKITALIFSQILTKNDKTW